MVGADIVAGADGEADVLLDPRFEHAVVLIDGDVALGEYTLEPSTLYYLGTGREAARLTARAGSRLMLLGGQPFAERILMWWNFVGRTPEEIAQRLGARESVRLGTGSRGRPHSRATLVAAAPRVGIVWERRRCRPYSTGESSAPAHSE
jgi:quercetin 2,3-dioxygenase